MLVGGLCVVSFVPVGARVCVGCGQLLKQKVGLGVWRCVSAVWSVYGGGVCVDVLGPWVVWEFWVSVYVPLRLLLYRYPAGGGCRPWTVRGGALGCVPVGVGRWRYCGGLHL